MRRATSCRSETNKPTGLLAWLTCLCLLAPQAFAREKHSVRPLDPYDAEQLALSTVGVVRRAPPHIKLYKITDTFMLMIPIGPAFVPLNLDKGTNYESQLAYAKGDPAALFEEVLAQAIKKKYAPLDVLRTDQVSPAAATPDQVLAVFPESQYVLDVHSRNILAGKTAKLTDKKAWVGYGVEVRLLARGMVRPVFSSSCYLDSLDDNPPEPTVAQLTNDDAKLFYRALGSFAWQCLHRVAADFGLPEDAVPVTPDEFADPLAPYRKQ